ncbi:hypothetical protein [Granulosicoccus antarcticus]|uniref:Ferric oxidoreductase domain-containing protein n=1 Tax=Granulosicoccus antarcticus IMCC3135 TaxID=1192854 RepID=A0A2Z2P4B5_9GAMM|nr:hypothetical protein [Granulosicoccus antarcticus]ASJ76270.1 hypothetical protein IMCC3135_31105 [Granulosicoccus antarcticus IMCC3135]
MRMEQSEVRVKVFSAVVFLVVLLLPFILWVQSVGHPVRILEAQLPAGQQFYLLSKLFALYAVFLVALQVLSMLMIGVAGVRGARSRWPIHRHQTLALLIAVTIVGHVGCFMTAVQLRSEHAPWFLLLPRFNSGFYDAMVSVGVVSAYLIMMVIVMGSLARQVSFKWARIHRFLVYPCIALIVLHSASIGSESRGVVMMMFYGFLIVGVVYALISRRRQAMHALSLSGKTEE